MLLPPAELAGRSTDCDMLATLKTARTRPRTRKVSGSKDEESHHQPHYYSLLNTPQAPLGYRFALTMTDWRDG